MDEVSSPRERRPRDPRHSQRGGYMEMLFATVHLGDHGRPWCVISLAHGSQNVFRRRVVCVVAGVGTWSLWMPC